LNIPITRKQFLKVTAVGAGAAALLSSVVFLPDRRDLDRANIIRIRPISGRNYSPSFLRFCERAKFTSTKEAMQRVKNRGVEYLLVVERG
jgi:hypothetical protein